MLKPFRNPFVFAGAFFFGAAMLVLYQKSRESYTFVGLDGPEPRQHWFSMQRLDRDGNFDYDALDAAKRQSKALHRRLAERIEAEGVSPQNVWQLRGPTNRGGRVTDLAGDRENSDKFYVGAASGGVWKTLDGGATFSPIFDGVGSPAIGALGISATDSNLLYVGTGEANPGGGSVAYPGDGVYRTTDGGASWEHLGLARTRYIGRIVVDPTDHDRVFVAATGNLFSSNAERGLYRTSDGGRTWSLSLSIDDQTGAVDVAIDPVNPRRIYATTWQRDRSPASRSYGGENSGVWRSTDGGDTWLRLSAGLPAGSQGRIGIAVSPSSPEIVYAIYADSTGYFKGLYRSTDGGDTFVQKSASNLSTFYSSYGWWFGRVFIHPEDANEVWVNGIYLYVSADGGESFSPRAGSTHVDHHAIWITPSDPDVRILGNDGGVYKSTDGGASWAALPIPIAQFYTIEADDRGRIFGGLQDNGVYRTTTGRQGDWGSIYGGDGFAVLVDPNDPDVIYAESQYGALGRSTDGGASFVRATTGLSGRINWHMPVVIDPSSVGGATVMYAGTDRLHRSTDQARSWAPVSPDLTDGDQGSNGVTFGTITTIAIASTNRNVIYVGTDDGNVSITRDYGVSWTKVSAALPKHWISRVTVDPRDARVAYAAISGFRNDLATAHIYRTTDYGENWQGIGEALPNAPVNDILVNPNDSATLYVASDVGVFVSRDTGVSWDALGTGMPEQTVVADIKISQGKLYAGTYGRATYSVELW